MPAAGGWAAQWMAGVSIPHRGGKEKGVCAVNLPVHRSCCAGCLQLRQLSQSGTSRQVWWGERSLSGPCQDVFKRVLHRLPQDPGNEFRGRRTHWFAYLQSWNGSPAYRVRPPNGDIDQTDVDVWNLQDVDWVTPFFKAKFCLKILWVYLHVFG